MQHLCFCCLLYTSFEQNGLLHVSSVLAETGLEVSAEKMREHLLARLSAVLEWKREDLLSRYRKRCVTVGREIRTSGGVEGICKGISDQGELVVCDGAGEVHYLNSGEVSISGMY